MITTVLLLKSLSVLKHSRKFCPSCFVVILIGKVFIDLQKSIKPALSF